MPEIVVNGTRFLLDQQDMHLVSRGNLHVRRGGRNREHHRYLYYRAGGTKGYEFSIARLILGLEPGDRSVMADHINRDTTDNRRANLRVATPLENRRNHGPHVLDGRFSSQLS
jgi:hypothetical protein